MTSLKEKLKPQMLQILVNTRQSILIVYIVTELNFVRTCLSI